MRPIVLTVALALLLPGIAGAGIGMAILGAECRQDPSLLPNRSREEDACSVGAALVVVGGAIAVVGFVLLVYALVSKPETPAPGVTAAPPPPAATAPHEPPPLAPVPSGPGLWEVSLPAETRERPAPPTPASSRETPPASADPQGLPTPLARPGAPPAVRFRACPFCGDARGPGRRFCPGCGSELPFAQ